MMARTLLTTCCFALLCSPSFAQLDIPPLPESPAVGQDGIAEPFQPEALTRGPVHEAFAEQINANPSLGILVAQAPPEAIDEIPPEYKPQGDNIVWIPGYWWWDEDASGYLWVSGVWRAVPPGQQWVAGYWAQADDGFQWVSGFFTSQQPDELVYQEAPPISLDNGPTIPAPSDEHFWNPGHWDAGYQWHAGYWQPLQEDRVWIPSRWVATPQGCCFVPGHWDYQLASRGQLFAPVRFADPCPPQYVYQPTCAIQPSVLAMHLFVQPRWRTYCFGDWYDQCATGSVYSYANYHTGGFGYCPLFAYSRARYARSGINLALRLGSWNRYFTSNRGFRPRRTFASQRLFARQNLNRPFSNFVNIGVNFRDFALRNSGIRGGSRGRIGGSLVAGRNNNGLRFQKINAQQIRRERERSQVIRTVAKQRAKRESVVSTSKVLQRGLARSNTSIGGRQRTDIFRDRTPPGRSSVSERSRTTVRSGNTPGGQINRSLSRSGSNRNRSNTSPARNSSSSRSRSKTQLPGNIVKVQDKAKQRPAVGPKLPGTRTGRTKTTSKNDVVIRSQSPGKTASNTSSSRTRSSATTSGNKSRNVVSSRTRTPASQPNVNSRTGNGSQVGARGTSSTTRGTSSRSSRSSSSQATTKTTTKAPSSNSRAKASSSRTNSRTSSTSRLGSSGRTRSSSTPSTRSRSNSGASSSRTSSSSTRNRSTPPISSRSSSSRSSSSSTRRQSSTPPSSSRSSRSSSNSSRTRSSSPPPTSSRSRSSSSSSRSSSSPSIRSRSNSGASSSRTSSSSTRSRSTPPISSRSGSSRSSSSSTRRQSSTPPSSSRSSRSSSNSSRSSSSRPSSSRSRSSSSSSRSSSSLSSRSRSNSSSARSSSSRSRSSSSSSRSGSSRSGGSSKSSSRSRRKK